MPQTDESDCFTDEGESQTVPPLAFNINDLIQLNEALISECPWAEGTAERPEDREK